MSILVAASFVADRGLWCSEVTAGAGIEELANPTSKRNRRAFSQIHQMGDSHFRPLTFCPGIEFCTSLMQVQTWVDTPELSPHHK